MNIAPDVNPLAAVSRVLIAQLSAGMLIGGIALVADGRTAAWSALLGGLICVIPNAFMGLRIVAGGADNDPRRMVTASYVGMAGKLALTAAMFAAVFVLVKPLAAGWLFTAFVMTQAIVLIFLVSDRDSGSSTTG